MTRALFFFSLCLVGATAVAEELSPKAQKVIALGEIRRKERLTELEGGIQILKARMIEQMRASGEMGTGVPANALAQSHAVKATQDRIDVILSEMHNVKTAKVYYPNIILNSLHPGDIGILVDQLGSSVSGKIATIVDEKNMIVMADAQPLWLAASTKGLKVGKRIEFTMPLEVMGTTTHKSIDRGSKKIFVMQPFSLVEGIGTSKQTAKTLTEKPR